MANSLSITFVHVSGHGSLAGGFKVTTDYAQALQDRGHAVTLVSPKPRSRPAFDMPVLRKLPFRKARTPQRDFTEDRTFQQVVLDREDIVTADDVPDADVILASWWAAVHWISGLPPSKGKAVHFVQGYELFPYLPQQQARAALAADMPKICVADWLEQRLREEHGASCTFVVRNGVDTSRFEPSDGPRGSRFGLLYARAPEKRVGLGIDAARLATPGGATLIGFGQDAPPAHHADAFSDFHVRPAQAAIPPLYASCKAWLFPSESEGFGLPILEAMAAGTPVIATRAGAAPDLIDGTNGVLIDPTPEAMAAQIARFAAMPHEEWLAMSRAAVATAADNTLDKATARFEAVLQEIAAGQ